MKVVGKVIEKSELQSGTSKAGKEWQNQTIVLEFEDGKYTKHLAVQFFKTELLKDVSEGGMVAVECNVESKKHNDIWFTNVNGWKIDIENLMPTSENDMPF